MGSRELTLNEILTLEKCKNKYIEQQLNKRIALIVSIAGFCTATLSVQKIPSAYNFFISFIILAILLAMLLFTKTRGNPLRAMLGTLYNECGEHANSKDILDEMNVWVGFEKSKVELWTPVLISALFIVYTLTENGIKAFKWFGL